ncbi:MAG: transposase [Balneolaceae bacterium]|nr:transposase [Balneolaceae bacterium]
MLDVPGLGPEDIQAFYQQRGTSEQFHSELKTDLDLERLPSGKFQTNQHILDLGMIAYNILRLLGQQMLATGQVPGRKAESARLRLRTVLNSLIYMAGRLVRHARRQILRIFEGHGWADVALGLARAP